MPKRYMNKFLTVIVLFSLLTGCKRSSAQASGLNSVRKNGNFRVVGYLTVHSIENGAGASFDFSRINYLNIAFINPDAKANFTVTPALASVITAAHAKNTKVLVSIGGGSAPEYYTSLLSDPLRNILINNLVKLVADNNLDGVDVDLEGQRIDNNYEAFVTGLSVALKSKNKLLTSAFATAYKSQYTDKALAVYDFINIMSYDKTGPWRPANPGQHAPYDMAVSDLEYWTNTRGIAKEKLCLGVPFYGYGFGAGAPADMNFSNIAAQYPGSENTDEVTVTGGGIIYYNGIPTIKNKTTLALQNAGGVMIWQLMGDDFGSKSLLNVINKTINSAK
ncbi:Chitinase, GH18 family [Mucilaginibacter sp. OK098]|nr:Chitinase, GH18 family [Mucilaginibacter sp. OK098]